ncbi:MAG: hypothetical protein K2H74_08635 [Paramuribaculum sp.]|nr:hypothetical protein [Paramuribaculum sp.]
MKLRNYYVGIGALISGTVCFLSSCSTYTDKANDIIGSLSENEGVISVELLGDDPEVITYSMGADSITAILIHSLNTNTVDTLTRFLPGFKMLESVPVEDGYLIVYCQERQDGNEHYIYHAQIKRHIGNPKEASNTDLRVDETRPELWASGYVIDREAKKITLNSYDVQPSHAVIYHTVYDFKGNKLVSDPVHIDIPQKSQASPSSSSAMYLWQCQRCGAKKNSRKNPGPGLGLGSCWHEWVNIGRVD